MCFPFPEDVFYNVFSLSGGCFSQCVFSFRRMFFTICFPFRRMFFTMCFPFPENVFHNVFSLSGGCFSQFVSLSGGCFLQCVSLSGGCFLQCVFHLRRMFFTMCFPFPEDVFYNVFSLSGANGAARPIKYWPQQRQCHLLF
jgi:hypothetical protein